MVVNNKNGLIPNTDVNTKKSLSLSRKRHRKTHGSKANKVHTNRNSYCWQKLGIWGSTQQFRKEWFIIFEAKSKNKTEPYTYVYISVACTRVESQKYTTGFAVVCASAHEACLTGILDLLRHQKLFKNSKFTKTQCIFLWMSTVAPYQQLFHLKMLGAHGPVDRPYVYTPSMLADGGGLHWGELFRNSWKAVLQIP